MSENKDEKRNNDGTFKKGVSGNPSGKPIGALCYANSLKKILSATEMEICIVIDGEEKKINVESKGRSFYDGIAAIQVMEALKGNIQAVREITNRLEGMPTQQVLQTIDDKRPMDIVVDNEKTAKAMNDILGS